MHPLIAPSIANDRQQRFLSIADRDRLVTMTPATRRWFRRDHPGIPTDIGPEV